MKEVKAYEEKEPFDPRLPIKFSTSPAAKWNMKNIRLQHNPVVDAPWYKQILLWGTLMGSVIYLSYYRKGNDIDEELEMPLGKRVLWIKEQTILKDRNHALQNGLSTKPYDAELEEISKLRKKYNYD